jgi:hypothetical protein
MPCREIVLILLHERTKHINTIYGWSAELFNVKRHFGSNNLQYIGNITVNIWNNVRSTEHTQTLSRSMKCIKSSKESLTNKVTQFETQPDWTESDLHNIRIVGDGLSPAAWSLPDSSKKVTNRWNSTMKMCGRPWNFDVLNVQVYERRGVCLCSPGWGATDPGLSVADIEGQLTLGFLLQA